MSLSAPSSHGPVIQCLKAMCAADIIVVEKSNNALKHAIELGADKGVLIDGNEHDAIIGEANGAGAEAVIDFVGEHGSTSMGLNMTANEGYYYIVGYGEEVEVLAVDMIISEKNIVGNLVGTWAELYELMELANKEVGQTLDARIPAWRRPIRPCTT